MLIQYASGSLQGGVWDVGQGVQIRAHSTASWSSKDEDIPLGAWCISAHLSPVLAPSLVSPCLYSVKRPLLSASICTSLQLSHSVSLYIILWFVSLFFFPPSSLQFCQLPFRLLPLSHCHLWLITMVVALSSILSMCFSVSFQCLVSSGMRTTCIWGYFTNFSFLFP